jgi:hypothetical protein
MMIIDGDTLFMHFATGAVDTLSNWMCEIGDDELEDQAKARGINNLSREDLMRLYINGARVYHYCAKCKEKEAS